MPAPAMSGIALGRVGAAGDTIETPTGAAATPLPGFPTVRRNPSWAGSPTLQG